MSWTKPGDPITYASPLVITQKGANDVRITADFRMVNKDVARTRIVPGIRIDELQAIFKDWKIFSKIDLNNGYQQFYVEDDSKHVLTVTTPWGNLVNNTLGQGFIISQDEFDRNMAEIVGDIPRVKANRDDCLIGGTDWKDHNKTLETVLSRIKSYNLTLNEPKCQFGKTELEFYGVIFCEKGIKPSIEKIKALKECKAPASKEGVRSFIQMVGYMSRFIPNFSTIASPLRELIKKNVPFKWTKAENDAFEALKNSLTEETLLAYFKVGKPIRVYVDAAKTTTKNSSAGGGLCGILTQQDENGDWCMVHVANKSLSDVETRYGQTELESLAIRYACKTFHHYLVGAPHFKIVTDCKPLVHLYNNPRSQAPLRIERHILDIQGLDYEVQYEKGQENIADYLSRHVPKQSVIRKITSKQQTEIENTYFRNDSKVNRDLQKKAEKDDVYQKLISTIENDTWKDVKDDNDLKKFRGVANNLSVVNRMVFFNNLLIPPTTLQEKYVKIAHELGHSGETRTFELLKERIWFPGISTRCKKEVEGCLSCQIAFGRTYDEPLKPTKIPSEPWHTIAVDYKGPLKDGKYCLIGYDLHSRYPVVDYTNSTKFSKLKHVFDKWIAAYGTPYKVKSDGGPPFNGTEFRNYS